jgi:hypothetical protein
MSWKHIIAIAAVAILSATSWAGGWPIPADQQFDGRGLSSSFRHDNLIRDENRVGRLVTSELGGQFDSLLFAGDRWNWRYAYREFSFRERSLKQTDFTLASRSTTASIGLSLPLFAERVTVSSQSNLAITQDHSSIGFESRVSIRPFSFARFDLRLGRGEDALEVAGLFRGEDIDMLIPAAWTVSGFSGTVILLDNLTLTSGYDDFGLDSSRIDAPGRYSAVTLGAAEHRFSAVLFGSRQAAHVGLRYDHWQGSGKMFVRAGGVMFGQMASAGGEAERWLVDVSPPHLPKGFGLEMEHARVTAEAAGHVESWPFTEPLVDLLGIRRNFRAALNLSVWRLGVRTKAALPGRMALAMAGDIYRLYPDWQFADWMPGYLVFGIADLSRYHDRYDRVDFGRIRLRAVKPVGRLRLGCEVVQFFPIEVKKQSGGASAGAPAPSSGHGPRTDGGRRLRVWFDFAF